jgi:hypothetical protein
MLPCRCSTNSTYGVCIRSEYHTPVHMYCSSYSEYSEKWSTWYSEYSTILKIADRLNLYDDKRQAIRVADATPIARKIGLSKKKTPPFIYFLPFVPILLMILMSGKSYRYYDLSSFTPPLTIREAYRQQQQGQLRDDATSLSPPVIPQQSKARGLNATKQLQILKQGDISKHRCDRIFHSQIKVCQSREFKMDLSQFSIQWKGDYCAYSTNPEG